MNLYRSKTPSGLLWTGTQADAKEAHGGKDFEHIEVPTDKSGLIAFLNDMEARIASGGGPEPQPAPQVDLGVALDANGAVSGLRLIGDDTASDFVIQTKTPLPEAEYACVACHRSARVAKLAASSSAALSIKADLEDVHTLEAIDRIIAAAKDRRTAIYEVVNG